MTTNLERVQKAISFYNNLENPTLSQRVELSLICRRCSQISGHETIRDIFNDLYPEIDWGSIANSTSNHDKWLYRKMTGNGSFPELNTSVADGYELTHDIFWATDLGRNRTQNAELTNRISQLLESETNRDLYNEYLLCFYCLGNIIPVDKLSELESWFDNEWEENYHPYFVAAVLFALLT